MPFLLLKEYMFTTNINPNFEELFRLYCDINDITLHEESLIVSAIIAQDYNNILTFHSYGFLFYYFDQLVKGEITREQFITMGDIEGQVEEQINPHVYREEHPVYLTTLTPELVGQWKDNDLVLVDQVLYDYYVSQYGVVKSDAKVIVLE